MHKRILSLWLALFCVSVVVSAEDIPDRPEKIDFPPLAFEVPDPSALRTELANGIPVYLVEDRLLPLVSISLFFTGGSYLDPAGKEGLADLTGEVWRTGGAGDMSAEELDEALDFLAANVSTGIGGTNGSASLNLLSKDLTQGLDIFNAVLLQPQFQEDRLEKAKTDELADMRRRNDSTAAIEAREWNRLIYGDDYWLNRISTRASIDAISRQDLIDFHKQLMDSSSKVIAVAGDFDREEMLDALNNTLGKIPVGNASLPPVPQPDHRSKPGLYVVNKSDVNQGRARIGHLGVKRPVEDEFAIRLANDVLGGGGFTSWILQRVRSDEGLAYSAGSVYSIGSEIPGTFRAAFQSKSGTVARAAELVLELIDRLRAEGATEEKLESAKNALILAFPNNFSSPGQTAAIFARDELIGRPHEYWMTYRDKARAVTPEDARLAAQKYIHPDQLVILIVGNIDEIMQGDPNYPDAHLEQLGEITRLPLRDPMTLQPMSEEQ